MADINFFEPDRKTPEKSVSMVMIGVIVIILAGVAAAFLTMTKLSEFTGLEAQKKAMVDFIESPDTKNKLSEYYRTQAEIAAVRSQNMPIAAAYADYRLLNTVTRSLIDGYVWAPIKASPDTMEFKSLNVTGNNLSIDVCVNDIGVMRGYQWDLACQKIKTDKDYIDKLPGSAPSDGDMEINKFRDQFTSQIVKQNDPSFTPPYEGTLGIFINKDITDDMYKLLGKGH